MRYHTDAVAKIVLILFCTAVALSAQTYTPLYTYPGTNNNSTGVVAPGLMAQGQDGLLYSTIQTNGTYNAGSVYSMTTSGTYNLLYSFCAEGGHCLTTGANPDGGVTLGFDGNLWGTAQNGAAGGAGTVFKITPAGTLTTVYDFANNTDDSAPVYPPLQGQDGNMYGVSEAQYNTQYGAFFKVSASGTFTTLSDFTYTNGDAPNLPTQGTDGNFYGTAQYGGDPTCRCGVVYKATPTGTVTVLHIFKGYPSDGYRPYGTLVQGTDGNYYGITYEGGAHNYGSVFKVTPAGVFTLVYSFGNYTGDGTLPIAALTLGNDGNFYGSTVHGGAMNYGAIFKLTPAGVETILHSACSVKGCVDGIYPETPLVQHTDGKFYGTMSGNSLCCGVFYSLDAGLKPFAGLVTWMGKVGKTVEILGQGFTGTTKVSFNGTTATFKVVSDTYLTATVPAGATAGFLTVTTPGAALKSNRKFLVTPAITSFNPTSGPVGIVVTLTGTSFTGATRVAFGAAKATVFSVDSDTQITATVPTGAVTSKIQVTTAGGSSSSASSFTVTP